MAFTYIIKKPLVNTLFNETVNIPTEKSITKLVNARAYIYLLFVNFEEASKKLGVEIKFTHLGYTVDEWTKDISTRIEEINTPKCFSTVEFNSLSKEGFVEYTFCNGKIAKSEIKFGFNRLSSKECIQENTLKPLVSKVPAPTINKIFYKNLC